MLETLKFVGSALASAAVVAGLLAMVLNALIKWSRSKDAANSQGTAVKAREAVPKYSGKASDKTGTDTAAAYSAI